MPKKGLYIWQASRLGTPETVVEELKNSGTEFVAIKVHNGTYYWQEVEPYVNAIKQAGIEVGGWGYVYFFNPQKEALVAAKSARELGLSFYLIDAEAEAKTRHKEALRFAYVLKNSIGDIPVGLTSYRYPKLHPEFPWGELRNASQFDAPQVYWRAGDPEANLDASYEQFKGLSPALPYKMPAGDMFFERGIKPTPEEIVQFFDACKKYPEITHVLMWSLDQKTVVPELWQAYSSYRYDGSIPSPIPDPQPEGGVLYSAVTTGSVNVREEPCRVAKATGALRKGSRIDVYDEIGNWAAINKERTEWCHKSYIKEL